MSSKTTASILTNAEETLRTAKQGLSDVLSADPARRLGGLRNLVVFGRAVTDVLQNLRSTEPDFDIWYQPFVEEMRKDDLLRFFYVLRSQILKEGVLPTSVRVRIHRLEFPKDLARFGPPPKGAKGFFIGDQAGGSGWEVQLPDGSTEKFYVDLPSDVGLSRVEMPSAPRIHLGKPVPDASVEVLAELYFDYLKLLVDRATQRFTKNSAEHGA